MLYRFFVLSHIFFFGALSIKATNIQYTFANTKITSTTTKYFNFDVMVAAGAAGTKIGDVQIYINYNPGGFGTNIVQNNKLTVTKHDLINNDAYRIKAQDNEASKISITVEYLNAPDPYDAAELSEEPIQLLNITIEIENELENAGLSFEESYMIGNQYEYDNSQKYSPVIASDLDDSSLPVTLTNFYASVFNKYIRLSWVTESEIENAGFEILRSEQESGDFTLISSYLDNPDLIGQSNSSTKKIYQYEDKDVFVGLTYRYKLVDVDYNGQRCYHGPISVFIPEIPTEYQLFANYPNPFNPTTTIKFAIPANKVTLVKVSLIIFDNLGQQIKSLVEGTLAPGTYALIWDGKNDQSQPVGSGVYFVVFRTEDFLGTRKLILLE